MWIKTTVRYHFIPIAMAIIKEPSVSKCVENSEPSYTAHGDRRGCSCSGHHLTGPQTVRESLCDQQFHSQYMPKTREICSHRNVFTDVHDSSKAETSQTSIKWRMDKQMWYIPTMEYYSAVKSNERLVHDLTEMNLENIMLVKETSHKRLHIAWLH